MTLPGEISDAELVARVRDRADLPHGERGPTDEDIARGVRGFVRQFAYWYNRVLDDALREYESRIIGRINPMIRGMELEGLDSTEAARRLVADYAHRNYVTAGGWALEQLAIDGSPRLRKSTATGIDAEWEEPGPPKVVHLYVLKSGVVTRNSDILAQLKAHGSHAQKLLMQTDRNSFVRVHYVQMTGQRSSSFHDGVHRPSSAEFWAQAFGLEGDERKAIDLAVAMAQEAGGLLRSLSDRGMHAIELAVAAYIASKDDAMEVDWEFLAQRNMIKSSSFKSEGERRVRAARRAVENAGYSWPPKKGKDAEMAAIADAVASVTPELAADLAEMLPGPDAED